MEYAVCRLTKPAAGDTGGRQDLDTAGAAMTCVLGGCAAWPMLHSAHGPVLYV